MDADDARSQGISSNGIDLFVLEYYDFSNKELIIPKGLFY